MIEQGSLYSVTVTVSESDTAEAMGSGDMNVLATPRMVALMENAAMLAVAQQLPEGSSTVGSLINVTHLRPTAVGSTVQAVATLEQVEGRKLVFHVEVNEGGILIGEGTHVRYIVDRVKFLSKI